MDKNEVIMKIWNLLNKWVPKFKTQTMGGTGLSTDQIINELIFPLIEGKDKGDGTKTKTLLDEVMARPNLTGEDLERFIATSIKNAMRDLQAERTREAKMTEYYDAPKDGNNNTSAALDANASTEADFGDMEDGEIDEDSQISETVGEDTAFTPEAVDGVDPTEIGEETSEDPHAELAEVESQINTIQQSLVDMEDKGEDKTPEYHTAYAEMKKLFARRKELEAAGGDELALERLNARVDALSEHLMEMEDRGEGGTPEYKRLREKWKKLSAQQKALKSRSTEMTAATKRNFKPIDLRSGSWDEDTRKLFTDKWRSLSPDEQADKAQWFANSRAKREVSPEFRDAIYNIINNTFDVKEAGQEGQEETGQRYGSVGSLAARSQGFDHDSLHAALASVITDSFGVNGPRDSWYSKDKAHYREYGGSIDFTDKATMAKYCDGKSAKKEICDVLNEALNKYLETNPYGVAEPELLKCYPYGTKISFSKLVKRNDI